MRRRWRLAGPAMAVMLVVGACAETPPEAADSTTTSTVITTSTTVPSTTTTTTPTTTTTTTLAIPEGIPPEAFARVGAPYPDFDTTFPDGFDAELWLRAYEEWNLWAFANPEQGLATIDQWVVEGSDLHESLTSQLEDSIRDGWITVHASQLHVDDLQELDMNAATSEFLVITRVEGALWIVTKDGEIVSEDAFSDSVSRELRVMVRRMGDDRWNVEHLS